MRQRNSYSRILYDITSWESHSLGEKIRLFQHAVEKDITSFVTIGPSRNTLTNDSLGTALSESGLSRDEIQLIGGINKPPVSPDDLLIQVEETLDLMKTDYLDLLFIDPSQPTETVMPAVERLFSQGKIQETGIYGSQVPEQVRTITACISSWDFTWEHMRQLRKEPVTLNPLSKMLWVDPFGSPPIRSPLDGLTEKYDQPEPVLLLAWLLQHPAHYHPVLSGNSTTQIDAAATAHGIQIIREDWDKIPFDTR